MAQRRAPVAGCCTAALIATGVVTRRQSKRGTEGIDAEDRSGIEKASGLGQEEPSAHRRSSQIG
jgi:hypothetical protein